MTTTPPDPPDSDGDTSREDGGTSQSGEAENAPGGDAAASSPRGFSSTPIDVVGVTATPVDPAPITGTQPPVESEEARSEREGHDRSLIQSIAWTGSMRWLSQILTWAITLAVARILTPEDYGIVGMAAVFFGLVNLVNDFGLSTAIVVVRDLDEYQVKRINGLALVVGACCFVIFCALAAPIGAFYGAEELPAVVLVMSVSFLITAFRGIPQGLLEKELRFKRIALIGMITAAATSISTLIMAAAGFGYWALVLANLVRAAVMTGLMYGSRPTGFARPKWDALKAATAISVHVTVGRLAWFVWSNADYVIAGKVLGKEALGFYSFAFMLASLPVDKISSIVTKVSTAFMSAVQTDHASLRRYLLGLTQGLSLVAFPIGCGMALVAGDFVPLILGDKWLGMIGPLQILAAYASVRAIDPVLAPVLNVTGETKYGMQMSVLFAILLPIGFYFGSTRWDVIGLAAAWVVLHPLFMGSLLLRAAKVIEMPLSAYFGAIWPALCSVAIMSATVVGVDRASWPDTLSWLELFAKIAAGGAAYALSMLILFRSRLVAAVQALKHLRRGRPAAVSPEA